jgi:hypothetical protein
MARRRRRWRLTSVLAIRCVQREGDDFARYVLSNRTGPPVGLGRKVRGPFAETPWHSHRAMWFWRTLPILNQDAALSED